jgi:hypothetical protein
MSGISPSWNTFAYSILPLLTAQFGAFVVGYFLINTDQPSHIAIIVGVALALVMAIEMILMDHFGSDGVITRRENVGLLFCFTVKIFLGFILPTLFFAIVRDDLASSPSPTALQLLVLAELIIVLVVIYTGFLGMTIYKKEEPKQKPKDTDL